MTFDITPERRAYLDARGLVVLNACPGSGKTTCIVHKLKILEKECLEQFGPHAGIACLSFTNRAKNEIQEKYNKAHGEYLKFPHHVSTIDSFINHFITLPYYNIIDSTFKRPKIIDDNKIINESLLKYYKVGDVVKQSIKAPFNKFKNKSGRQLYWIYAPSDIWIELDGTYSFKGKQPSPSSVDSAHFQDYGNEIFKWKTTNGLFTSLDSAYLATRILAISPRIGTWLAKRFPYIIIDESQDNSAIQHALFDALEKCGVKNIELIGDPYQSLYEWRDAKPTLFADKYKSSVWAGLPLSNNRRSNQRIVDCFSILRSPADPKISSPGVVDLGIPITIYKYNDSNHPVILTEFETKCKSNKLINNCIVVRGNPLKEKMLGITASVDPWKTTLPISVLKIKHLYETQNIKEAVDKFRKLIFSVSNTGVGYHEQKEIEKKAKSDYNLNAALYSLLSQLPPSEISLEQWSNECINLLKPYNNNIDTYFDFKGKINGYKMASLKKEKVKKYFQKPSSTLSNIPISTIHQVKGATLDALLCFFSEDSSGENISFTNFSSPIGFPTEKQRMIYVACSRPSQFLAMAFPATISDNDLKNTFGGEIDIILP